MHNAFQARAYWCIFVGLTIIAILLKFPLYDTRNFSLEDVVANIIVGSIPFMFISWLIYSLGRGMRKDPEKKQLGPDQGSSDPLQEG